MPLASLRCRFARFVDGRLNQKVKIRYYLKKISAVEQDAVLEQEYLIPPVHNCCVIATSGGILFRVI